MGQYGKVGIVMGSDSDLPIMSKAADILEKFGIEYELTVISAHRMPDVFFDYANTAKEKGVQVIIAGAGGAAHLPGMCGYFSTSGYRRSNSHKGIGRRGFPLFHCADAKRHSGSNRSN